MNLKMTPKTVVFGGILILAAIVFSVVYWPWAARIQVPSDIHRDRAPEENEGRAIYIANGGV